MGKGWISGFLILMALNAAAAAQQSHRSSSKSLLHAMQSGHLAAFFGINAKAIAEKSVSQQNPEIPQVPPAVKALVAPSHKAIAEKSVSQRDAEIPQEPPAVKALAAPSRKQMLQNAIRDNTLGVEYDKGIGVPQSAALAAYWYGRAARLGYAKAQYNLANDYYFGRGVPQSYAKANQWFRAAARQGYKWGEWSLGQDEYYGRGEPKNWPRALYWLQRAATHGLYTFELDSLQVWQQRQRERAEARSTPPSNGCTSRSGPRRLTVINESQDEKDISEVEIDAHPSPLFGVNDYLAPGHEMVFPVFPYATDPENYTVTLVGTWHAYLYHVQSCNQMTIVFRP